MATKPVTQIAHPLIHSLAGTVRDSKDLSSRYDKEASKAQNDLTSLLLDVLTDGLGTIEVIKGEVVDGVGERLFRLTRSKSQRHSLSVEKLLELGVNPSIIEQAHTTTESFSLRITEQ